MATMDTETIEAGLGRLRRQFMKPVIYRANCWEVSTDHGSSEYVPEDVEANPARLAQYVEGKIDEDRDPILHVGIWLARLSAPGYMDCTDWSIHLTERAAAEYLIDTYDDGEPEDES